MALFRMKPHYSKRSGVNYKGTITSLDSAVFCLAATSVGNYALFAGGVTASMNTSSLRSVNVYNDTLVKCSTLSLNYNASQFAATSLGDYALFGGGRYYGASNIVNAFDKSLTLHSSISTLNDPVYDLAAATGKDYAFFIQGYDGSRTCYYVNPYNKSITRTSLYSFADSMCSLAAAAVGEYVLFGSGQSSDHNMASTDIVYGLDNSLTRLNAPRLTTARSSGAAASVGNYALFAGGSTQVAEVDAYDTSLTKRIITPLSAGRSSGSAVSIGNYAVFGGGNFGYPYSISFDQVDVYDSSLVRTNASPLSISRGMLAAAAVGDYILFAGGIHYESNRTYVQNTVDVYQVT